MNFGKNAVARALKAGASRGEKYRNFLVLAFARALFFCALLGAALFTAAGFGAVRGIMESAPDLNVSSISHLGYATSVYDASGALTETLVMAGSNREEATYGELPDDLGSTITQQLIKNNVFNGGREKTFGEKLERKIQEWYLAVKLEKVMDKKVILTNYLNTINLGNNSLGVKVAARRYFNKEVSDLTLSECAVLAGITQNPSRLNPISGQEANSDKRKVILKYMYDQGYITREEQQEALADDVYSRIQNVDLITKEKASHTYSYFTDVLIGQVLQDLKDKYGYSDTQAHNLLYSGGLSIYTTQDPSLQKIVDAEINNPENYSATKYSLEYRLSVQDSTGATTNYGEHNIRVRILDIPTTSYAPSEGQEWVINIINNILIEVLSSQAEHEQNSIRKRQAEGIAIAKAKGKYRGGQQKQVNEDMYQFLYAKYMRREISKKDMAAKLGVSRPTLDRIIKRHIE